MKHISARLQRIADSLEKAQLPDTKGTVGWLTGKAGAIPNHPQVVAKALENPTNARTRHALKSTEHRIELRYFKLRVRYQYPVSVCRLSWP